MATGHSNEGVKESALASTDRFWILVNARNRESYLEQLSSDGSRGSRETLVVRDGEHVLISVDVGRGSALAVPFKIDELACSGATLVVRLISDTAPCARCVDDSLASAVEARGGLDAAGIFGAVRAGISRCAARAHTEPTRAEPGGACAPPESSGARSTGALHLVPPNAPHVTAGGVPASCDVDVVLLI
jgi:hypothetical protein